MTRFRIYEAYFRLGFGCMWRFYRAVPCRRPRLMKGHIVMGATALVTYLGLADVPGSHLTRVELVIDALTGRRGGPYAEIGATPRV